MKKIVLFSFAIAAISSASCKKARTCSCNGTTTTTTTTTDASGAVTYSNVDSSPEAYTDQLTSATKAVAKGHRDCMSRTKTSSNSYTVGGSTTKVDNVTDLDCTIK